MSMFANGASIDEVFAAVKAAGFYRLMKVADDRSQIVAVTPMMFTTAIVYGVDETGIAGRCCYTTATGAILAFLLWAGAIGSEPIGWIRHPETGRRRPNGDEAQEYVHR